MKFSIITPVYNMRPWIRETIESVLSQAGDFFIEYIIVDDSSTDGTSEIVREYAEKVSRGEYLVRCAGITMRHIVRKEKSGMYSAINAGFREAMGDIFAWINADDAYEPGAFMKVAQVFETFPEIQWLKGITGTMDEAGEKKPGQCFLYREDWLAEGIYGQESYFVAQDSCFWRRRLWQKVGGIPEHFRYAGDYWLWMQFAKHSPLISLNTPVSYFRRRAGQLSKDISKYKHEQQEIRPKRSLMAWKARVFFSIQSRLSRIFPGFRNSFIKFYPVFFGISKPMEYLEEVDGKILKRKTRIYVLQKQP